MRLEIISPEGMVYEGEATRVSLPGKGGRFDVLPLHAPLIAALTEGAIRFEADGRTEERQIRSGFVEVKDDVLSVCVEQ